MLYSSWRRQPRPLMTPRAADLPRRVDDLRGKVLALPFDDAAEGVLDGRVVALDKVPVDELHRQGGFAWEGRSASWVLSEGKRHD